MMRGFDDIVLEWGGESYPVPASRQMELIYRVEVGLLDGRPGQAYQVLTQPGGTPLALLARVYASALIYAGAKVEPIEVYREITGRVAQGDGALMSMASEALLRILGVIAPDEEEAPKQSAKKT